MLAGRTRPSVVEHAVTPLIYLVLLLAWEGGVRAFELPAWNLPPGQLDGLSLRLLLHPEGAAALGVATVTGNSALPSSLSPSGIELPARLTARRRRSARG